MRCSQVPDAAQSDWRAEMLTSLLRALSATAGGSSSTPPLGWCSSRCVHVFAPAQGAPERGTLHNLAATGTAFLILANCCSPLLYPRCIARPSLVPPHSCSHTVSSASPRKLPPSCPESVCPYSYA